MQRKCASKRDAEGNWKFEDSLFGRQYLVTPGGKVIEEPDISAAEPKHIDVKLHFLRVAIRNSVN